MDQTYSETYTPPLILKVDGLVKIYGTRRVVDGVSFHVNRGEIVGLLGTNGAGKTTSFRMTCGMIEANSGVVFLNGKDVTSWPMYRRSKEGGMGYLAQDPSVFSHLSVQDNLLGVMELLGVDRRTRQAKCDELLEKFKLTHIRKNMAGSGGSGGLSGGERRRLEIARALVSNPKIILLDEPFAAIDPITVASVQEIVKQLAEEGIAILITDHSVRETLQITHRSYVIEAGRVLCHGTPSEVVANKAAREAYFGNSVDIPDVFTTSAPPSDDPVSQAQSAYEERQHHKKNEHRRKHPEFTPQEPVGINKVQEPEPEIPIRPRPQFSHKTNSGRPII